MVASFLLRHPVQCTSTFYKVTKSSTFDNTVFLSFKFSSCLRGYDIVLVLSGRPRRFVVSKPGIKLCVVFYIAIVPERIQS